jgi:hypothetical protein
MYFIAKCYYCQADVSMTDTSVPFYSILCAKCKK